MALSWLLFFIRHCIDQGLKAGCLAGFSHSLTNYRIIPLSLASHCPSCDLLSSRMNSLGNNSYDLHVIGSYGVVGCEAAEVLVILCTTWLADVARERSRRKQSDLLRL